MEHVHHKLLQVIGMIPQQFSSNENKKINAVRECSLFGTNFVILNTAAQYYANTFQSNHFARLTLVEYNKMAYNVKSLYFILH